MIKEIKRLRHYTLTNQLGFLTDRYVTDIGEISLISPCQYTFGQYEIRIMVYKGITDEEEHDIAGLTEKYRSKKIALKRIKEIIIDDILKDDI